MYCNCTVFEAAGIRPPESLISSVGTGTTSWLPQESTTSDWHGRVVVFDTGYKSICAVNNGGKGIFTADGRIRFSR